MGVKNLWNILESCKKTLPLHHLQNKRLCIDLSCWIVQLKRVYKCHASHSHYEKLYLSGLFHRLRALIALNCTLIFVTDGSIPAIKLSTYRKRLNSGNEVTDDERQVTEDEANSDKVTSLKRNMGSDFSCMIRDAKALGLALGVPCLDGIEEAEAQCALLNLESLCDGCFSSDSDIFLFGAKTVYRDIHLGEEGHVVCYEMADIERKLGYGRNSLITLALLLGGDYSKGVHGLGPEEACRIVKSIADNVVLERIASEGLSLVKKARNSRNLNGENQFLEVIDAYTKPKCHSADSDAVYRVLVQHPILHTKLHQICAQFFEWPSEKTDEYILPKIAERDLRRFANLRTSSAAVELPLHKMPVKCPVTGIIKPRRVRGTECFEVSWEESYGLKSSVVPAELIESACPEKIVEFKERKAAPRTKKSKPRSRIDQKLQALSLDIESGSSSVPSVAFSSKTVMPENMTGVSEVNFTRHDPFLDAESESDGDGNSNAAMPLYQTALESESKADGNARIPSNPAAPTNANYEVIDLISPSPAHCRNVSRSQKMSNQAISVIDLSDSDTERSPEHERKARELRLFLASIPD
ncbi:single-strand DNA endonuclease 1 isoform X2 [Mangifera indica]|uniref:single-strand DNA endonuclease 1 isoform X2 n=1 Tax=Mangifera indica TaxID=29780 RepID=UPI001CFB7246|nr:single-strand DNA endonuclease 1 isoform X2 [Mangifera indica]